MKFQEAFNKVYDIELEETIRDNPGQNVQMAIEKKSAKLMSMIWNILAVSGGKFDDLAYVDKHNNIISVPLKKEKDSKKDDNKKSSAQNIAAEGDNDSGSGAENS
jgi:hypothetical protein